MYIDIDHYTIATCCPEVMELEHTSAMYNDYLTKSCAIKSELDKGTKASKAQMKGHFVEADKNRRSRWDYFTIVYRTNEAGSKT